MNKKSQILVLIFFIFIGTGLFSQIPYQKGRIIYFSDGNGSDIDDIGSNGLTLTTLSKLGLQNKLKLFVYADYFWESGSTDHKAKNLETVNKAKSDWGYSSQTLFISGDNYNKQHGVIVNKIKTLIDTSSEADPLYLIFAGTGGFSYTYKAFEEVKDKEKLSYVTIISHSPVNENVGRDRDVRGGSSNDGLWEGLPAYGYDDVQKDFNQPTYIGHQQLLIQNGDARSAIDALNCNRFRLEGTNNYNDKWIPFNWMKLTSPTTFVLNQMKKKIRVKGKGKAGKADVSDFGMIWYLLTGNIKGNPYEVRDFYSSGSLPKPFYISNRVTGKRISSNFTLNKSNFTEDARPGHLKKNTSRSVVSVSALVHNLGTQWFKVPAPNPVTENENDFILVNAKTGLALNISNEINSTKLRAINLYEEKEGSTWYQQSSNPLIITNRSTGKQFCQKNNNNTEILETEKLEEWNLVPVSDGK